MSRNDCSKFMVSSPAEPGVVVERTLNCTCWCWVERNSRRMNMIVVVHYRLLLYNYLTSPLFDKAIAIRYFFSKNQKSSSRLLFFRQSTVPTSQ
mmetsp:Transcript_23951/g.47534  ORF Transcript_23951/g.47534 Transcript_23951/m.47534 type:complete len:94 (-) Transcript_23951:4107-4388(-)